MAMRLHTKNPDWHLGPHRSRTRGANWLAAIATDGWKWAIAAVIGLLVLSAVIGGYFAWNSRSETNASALLRQAVSQQKGTNQEEGVRLLREVMSRYPRTAASAEATLRLGTQYYTTGKYDEARAVYVTYLGQNPRGLIAFSAGIGVGDTYLAQHQYEKAVETYSQLIEQFSQEPLLPEAQLHLAKAYLGANRLKDAVALYEKIVATYPNTGWAQRAHAEMYRLSLTAR